MLLKFNQLMKTLTIAYNDTPHLKRVIDNTYFVCNQMGKIGNDVQNIEVHKNTTPYIILKDMGNIYVKIKNEIIKGTFKCRVYDYDDERIFLTPISPLSTKELINEEDVENYIYSFYH